MIANPRNQSIDFIRLRDFMGSITGYYHETRSQGIPNQQLEQEIKKPLLSSWVAAPWNVTVLTEI